MGNSARNTKGKHQKCSAFVSRTYEIERDNYPFSRPAEVPKMGPRRLGKAVCMGPPTQRRR